MTLPRRWRRLGHSSMRFIGRSASIRHAAILPQQSLRRHGDGNTKSEAPPYKCENICPGCRDHYMPLTSGATLCVPEESSLTPRQLLHWLEAQQISLIHTVPTVMQTWLPDVPDHISLRALKRVFLSGEPLTDTLVRRWRETFPDAGSAMSAHLLHGFERVNLQKTRRGSAGILADPAEASAVADKAAYARPSA